MISPGLALAQSALTLVGRPYRLFGRDPARGLDCVGLIAASLQACGREVGTLPPYSLRQHDLGRFLDLARSLGLLAVSDHNLPGDILVLRPSPMQTHLAIMAQQGGLIHAHAGLRQVVHTPGPTTLHPHHSWRLA